MIRRGDIYWADLGPIRDSGPAGIRPVVVVQDDRYNASRLATVIVASVTSAPRQQAMPGNVVLPASLTGLREDSAVNVTSVVAVDRSRIGTHVGQVGDNLMDAIDRGLRRVLGL